jgi:electron transfer flavoprotein beta subunit
MRIGVLVKEVPDTNGQRSLHLDTGLAERRAAEVVLDEIAERSIELALSLAGEEDEVVLVSMTPASAVSSLRKGLAMGADRAVQIVDEALIGADLALTARVLAAALRRLECELIVTGNQSTDGGGGVLPAMLAEILNLPELTQLTSVQLAEGKITGIRAEDAGNREVSADLPAVISITERFPEGRFPNFKGIVAAKKKPFETLSLTELDVDASPEAAPSSIMTTVNQRPPREPGIKVTDDGTAAAQLVEFLIARHLA